MKESADYGIIIELDRLRNAVYALMLIYVPCGDCGRTTQKGYVEILEFTHFVEFFSFNRIAENHKEKELVRKVTVVVALDLGCGNTNNSEYESK